MHERISFWFGVKSSKIPQSLERFISDQLKRDTLIEGAAASKSFHVRYDCLVTDLNGSAVKRVSMVGNLVGKGYVKSKEKTLSLTADGGGALGVVAMNRLQFWHADP